MIILNILILILGFIKFSRADVESSSILQWDEAPRLSKPAQELSLKLFSSSSYSQLEAEYLLDEKKELAAKKIQLLGGTYNETDFNYIALPEAYYKNGFYFNESDVSFDLSLGRKKSLAHRLDDTFHLGLLNPYFSTDYINYVPEGQVGVHTVIGNENLRIGVNYLPIFIPHQGPSIQEKNGELVGPTPWIPRAPRSFLYNGQLSPILYSIHDSDLGSIVQNSGYSASLSVGNTERQNWQICLSYADTPINEIVLARTIRTDLDLKSDVSLYPVVRYSEKWGADILFKQDHITYFISYLSDSPRNKLETDKTVQQLSSIYGYGAGLSIDIATINFGVSYGSFHGGEIIDLDSNGRISSFNVSHHRLLYREPLAIRAQWSATPVSFDINWIYDQAQRGSLFSFKAQHAPRQRMSLSLGFDILGVADEDTDEKYFLSEHSADDRITGGLKYVF